MSRRPSIRRMAAGRWAAGVVVYAMFFVSSAMRSPVPGVNEPQYLGKAKHLWDPTWAAGDFFLESSNPHLAFYLAVGWLTRFLSLEATAWIARGAGYALLATGWTMLTRRIAGSAWAAVPAAACFLLLGAIGNLSGEWLVGGIEGKVIAYGFLLAGVALWLDGRRMAAAACFGAAVSFHPIVGAWGVLCGTAAELTRGLRRSDAPDGNAGWLRPATAFAVTALPGLIPAAFTLGGASPAEAAQANYIQVFYRLGHHLDPTRFGRERYTAYAALLLAWLAMAWLSNRDRAPDQARGARWFRAFVIASVLVAVAGVAIGWHGGSAWEMPLRDLRTGLLKFYPFRLADVFVPLAFSMAAARLLLGERSSVGGGTIEIGKGHSRDQLPITPHTPDSSPRGEGDRLEGGGLGKGRDRAMRRWGVAAGSVVAFSIALLIPSPDRNPSRLPTERLAGWIDASRWVREETPEDALIVAPSRHWGFKWYAGRAEYVNYKDAPQDAPGLLEWHRRLETLANWWKSSATGQFSQSDLLRLGEATGAAYLLTPAYGPRFATEPLYDNGAYRVYSLR